MIFSEIFSLARHFITSCVICVLTSFNFHVPVFLFFSRGLLVVVLSFRDFVTRGLLVVVLSFPEIVTCCTSRTCRSMPMTRMGSPSRWVDAAGYNCRTAASPDASEPERGHVRQASSPVPAVESTRQSIIRLRHMCCNVMCTARTRCSYFSRLLMSSRRR